TLRPIEISNIFDDIRDSFAASIMGIGALHRKEYQKAMEAYKHIPLESTVEEDSFIDLWYFIDRINEDKIYNDSETPFSKLIMQNICQSFCITAFETLKETSHYSTISNDPKVQFLRHQRNASAHGNQFFFKPGQPDKKASWRNNELTSDLNGNECFFDTISTGDIPLILEDITKELSDKT